MRIKELTKNNVYKELQRKGFNEYDILIYYIPKFHNSNKINSTLREDDNNASMSFLVKNDRIIISDFGFKTGMDVFGYLKEKYFHPYRDGFYRALDLITQDFDLPLERLNIKGSHYSDNRRPRPYPKKFNKTLKNTESTEIKTISKKFSKADEEYWNQFGLSKYDFQSDELRAINKFRIKKQDRNLIFNVANELAFCYIFYNSKVKKKIYLPYGIRGDEKFKFIGNVSNSDVFNLRFIPEEGELLFITTSGKDAKVLSKYIAPAVAPQSEAIWMNDDIWYDLRKRFYQIVYFANNDYHKKDNPGLYYARQHTSKYDLTFITIPDRYKVTDPSEFIQEYGVEEFKKLRDDLILPNVELLK